MLRRIGTIIGLLTALGVTLGGSQKSPAMADYRVPAGAMLQARLRTTVGSASNQVDDQVDAILLEPVTADGIELIPAGSAIHGKVVAVTPASTRAPRPTLHCLLRRPACRHRQPRRHRHAPIRSASPPDEPAQGRRPKKYPVTWGLSLAARHRHVGPTADRLHTEVDCGFNLRIPEGPRCDSCDTFWC